MSYAALCKGRCSLPYQIYCITTVTRSRVPAFNDLTAARLLIRELRRLHESGVVNSLAWVVMPDHLHWMFQLKGHWGLSRVVKSMKACSARTVNDYLGQEGSLWQRAYYDRAVRMDDDVRQIARYIVANPLRAGLVARIGDYSHWDCIWLDGLTSTVMAE